MENLLDNLKNLLQKDERLVSKGELLKNKIVELALSLDKDLIELLLSDKQMKEVFFTEVGKATIFDKDKFIKFISNKQFLPDSYTAFKNKIGLVDEKDEFISEKKDVVLSWPYKDCVLEGGMTKEDQKRDEIFWNETLAPDEISRLLDPKTFTNAKRIDKDGEHKIEKFKTDENGNIKDNLIIKGNNLLALHSLKKRFAGKVKLIYIDPPYNTNNQRNSFTYNNSFKHSTWLTFMKNRLEVTKELLREDGVLQIAIDENEQSRLGVLLDEIFSDYEKHCITIVHNPRGVQGNNFSYTNEFVYFLFKKGLKVIHKIKRDNPLEEEFKDHGSESLRTDAKNCFYPILVKNNKIIGFGEVPNESFHPSGKIVREKNGIVEVWPIDVGGVERKWVFAKQTVEEIRDKLFVKTKSDGTIDIFRIKDEKIPRTVWIGERYDASTHGSKIVNKIIDGKTVSFPKSLFAVYDCIYSVTKNDKDAVILDFFAGSGTTAHATLDLNKEDGGRRQFILIEQLDEHVDVSIERIKQEIGKNTEDFVYMELAKWNENFVEKIQKAKTKEELKKLWETMKEKAFLSYKVDIKTIDDNAKDFEDLSIENQKRFLLECLDKNHLYVNYSEIDDEEYDISKEDKKVNKEFYGK